MYKENLNTNTTDYVVSILSATAGLAPFVGGFLSEIVQGVIPNQRQDRVVEFIKDLCDRLERLEYTVDNLTDIFSNYAYGAFTHKCLNCVVNEVYDEKIKYYRELCINGLTVKEQELYRIERILKVFSEMDYYEILYLKFYHYAKFGNRTEQEKITNELNIDTIKPNYMIGMEEEKRDAETYKQITLNNLEKNGLLEQKIKSVGTHGTAVTNYEITLLGELILKKIGIIKN